MSLANHKLLIIEKIIQTDDIVLLEEINHLLQEDSNDSNISQQHNNSEKRVEQPVAKKVQPVTNIDSLFEKNMPQQNEMSIDEIRALVAKTEEVLKK